jgi:thiamine pyrophosphate-dependent acetolactate synthase large subunit-like protein
MEQVLQTDRSLHIDNHLGSGPGRQTVAVVGDGGFAMLMAELATAVQHDLAVKVLILNNDRLAEVAFEQREAGLGYSAANCLR